MGRLWSPTGEGERVRRSPRSKRWDRTRAAKQPSDGSGRSALTQRQRESTRDAAFFPDECGRGGWGAALEVTWRWEDPQTGVSATVNPGVDARSSPTSDHSRLGGFGAVHELSKAFLPC